MKIPGWLWIVGGIIGVAALGTGGVVAVNYLENAWLASENGQKWGPALQDAENSFGIPSGLLSRIAFQESHFIQNIIDGTRTSPVGARGMMQLMPQFFQTVQRPTPFSDADTNDQIQEAAQFLSGLFNHFSDWTQAVAAYNAGQGTINQVLAGKRALPSETANYIAGIAQDLPGIVNPTLTA
jgi:soluble lytic murein transglycosylase-like protein